MKIKGLTDTNFTDYKLPSLYIATPYCSFKCDKECGRAVCQNSALAHDTIYSVPNAAIAKIYNDNPVTQAVVFGGLEPLDSTDLLEAITDLQTMCKIMRIVIYTGYTEEEVQSKFPTLLSTTNLVMKYGRFVRVKRETEALSAWFPTRETLSHLKKRMNTEDFITFCTELSPL